jgi:GT2 family glycosyltransferase
MTPPPAGFPRAETTALILSFNDGAAVVRCVGSLRASTHAVDVLVVDNASADGAPGLIRARCPEAEVIVNDRNLGFGAGCNVGIEAALARGAEFVLLLNQDTTAAPGLVEALVAAMRARPRAGVVGPKTWSGTPLPDGRQRILYAGSWRGRLPLSQRLPGIEQADDGSYDRAAEVDAVWGHGMMLRASALREVGLFDPAFFMYYEDIDLCRRMKAAGFEVWYEPAAVMWHDIADGARATRSEAWRWRHKVRSASVFHRKYHGAAAAAGLTALTVLSEARMLRRNHRYTAIRQLLGAYVRSALGTPVQRGT